MHTENTSWISCLTHLRVLAHTLISYSVCHHRSWTCCELNWCQREFEVSGTKRVTFRLASGGRVEHFFDPDDFTKVRIIHISAV